MLLCFVLHKKNIHSVLEQKAGILKEEGIFSRILKVLSDAQWRKMSCLPNLLQRWLCRDFLVLYFRKLILKPSCNVLPHPGRALGPQASHAIAFVFCFCSRAEAMPVLLFSTWRLQTRAEEEGGRGRKAGKEMDSCGLTRYSPASPHSQSRLLPELTVQPRLSAEAALQAHLV